MKISLGGAATPIVIASYVVGGSCAAYGVSNMIEGGQDIYYGSQGDASTIAVNPIRDTIFQGNEEMYTFWGEANMIAASFIMPANKGVQAVSQAKNATSAGQKAITFVRAAGTEVGKDLINGAFSTGVGYGVTELTGNQELGMAAGVLSSFAFGKGLDDIDESLNISGLSRPKGLQKANNYADDIDLSTSHAKSSADVDIVKPNNLFDNQNFNNPSKISGSDYKNADYLTTNGRTYQYDFEVKPVGDYYVNHNKNYVTNTSQADIDFQKPKSYQNRLVTEAIGYADDLPVPKTTSSVKSNVTLFDNSWNGSSEAVNTLTNAQKSRLNALDNTIKYNLKETDFSGTLRDLQGDPVPNPQGGYYDHLTEMKQSYISLTKIKRGLEGSLKNPNLSSIDREILQAGLDKANMYIERIESLFEPFGGIN